MCRDLQSDIKKYFHSLMKTLVQITNDVATCGGPSKKELNPELTGKLFETVSYLLKSNLEHLSENPNELNDYYGVLLGSQYDFVRKFASKSFIIVIKKISSSNFKLHYKKVFKVIGESIGNLLQNDPSNFSIFYSTEFHGIKNSTSHHHNELKYEEKRSYSLLNGFSLLFFNSMKGIKGHGHSKSCAKIKSLFDLFNSFLINSIKYDEENNEKNNSLTEKQTLQLFILKSLGGCLFETFSLLYRHVYYQNIEEILKEMFVNLNECLNQVKSLLKKNENSYFSHSLIQSYTEVIFSIFLSLLTYGNGRNFFDVNVKSSISNNLITTTINYYDFLQMKSDTNDSSELINLISREILVESLKLYPTNKSLIKKAKGFIKSIQNEEYLLHFVKSLVHFLPIDVITSLIPSFFSCLLSLKSKFSSNNKDKTLNVKWYSVLLHLFFNLSDYRENLDDILLVLTVSNDNLKSSSKFKAINDNLNQVLSSPEISSIEEMQEIGSILSNYLKVITSKPINFPNEKNENLNDYHIILQCCDWILNHYSYESTTFKSIQQYIVSYLENSFLKYDFSILFQETSKSLEEGNEEKIQIPKNEDILSSFCLYFSRIISLFTSICMNGEGLTNISIRDLCLQLIKKLISFLSLYPSSISITYSLSELLNVVSGSQENEGAETTYILSELLSDEEVDSLIFALAPSLITKSFYHKLHLLRIFSHIKPPRDEDVVINKDKNIKKEVDVVSYCRDILTFPLDIRTEREIIRRIELLEVVCRDGDRIPPAFLLLIGAFSLSLFHLKFKPVWASSITLLNTLFSSSKGEELVWPLLHKSFQLHQNPLSESEAKEIAQVEEELVDLKPRLNDNLIENYDNISITNKKLMEQHEFFIKLLLNHQNTKEESSSSAYYTSLINSNTNCYDNGSKMFTKKMLVSPLFFYHLGYETRSLLIFVDFSNDAHTYFLNLLSLLRRCPSIILKKSKKMVQYFFDFLNKQYYRVFTNEPEIPFLKYLNILGNFTSTDDLPPLHQSKQLNQQLEAFLGVFSSISSPKQLFKHHLLFALYNELLTKADLGISKLSLECIITYKFTYVTPYKERLLKLYDDKNFKNELMTIQFESSEPIVEDNSYAVYDKEKEDKENDNILIVKKEHFPQLVPILIRILYNKLITKGKGKKNEKASHVKKRSSIISFISFLPSEYYSHLFFLMIRGVLPLNTSKQVLGAYSDFAGSRDESDEIAVQNYLSDPFTPLKKMILNWNMNPESLSYLNIDEISKENSNSSYESKKSITISENIENLNSNPFTPDTWDRLQGILYLLSPILNLLGHSLKNYSSFIERFLVMILSHAETHRLYSLIKLKNLKGDNFVDQEDEFEGEDDDDNENKMEVEENEEEAKEEPEEDEQEDVTEQNSYGYHLKVLRLTKIVRGLVINNYSIFINVLNKIHTFNIKISSDSTVSNSSSLLFFYILSPYYNNLFVQLRDNHKKNNLLLLIFSLIKNDKTVKIITHLNKIIKSLLKCLKVIIKNQENNKNYYFIVNSLLNLVYISSSNSYLTQEEYEEKLNKNEINENDAEQGYILIPYIEFVIKMYTERFIPANKNENEKSENLLKLNDIILNKKNKNNNLLSNKNDLFFLCDLSQKIIKRKNISISSSLINNLSILLLAYLKINLFTSNATSSSSTFNEEKIFYILQIYKNLLWRLESNIYLHIYYFSKLFSLSFFNIYNNNKNDNNKNKNYISFLLFSPLTSSAASVNFSTSTSNTHLLDSIAIREELLSIYLELSQHISLEKKLNLISFSLRKLVSYNKNQLSLSRNHNHTLSLLNSLINDQSHDNYNVIYNKDYNELKEEDLEYISWNSLIGPVSIQYLYKNKIEEDKNLILNHVMLCSSILFETFRCIYDEDLAIRMAATHALKQLILSLIQWHLNAIKNKEDNYVDEWLKIISLYVLPQIRFAIQFAPDPVKFSFISLLKVLIINIKKNGNVIDLEFYNEDFHLDLFQLINEEDHEQDFFENISHIQLHRRARALLRIKTRLLLTDGKLKEAEMNEQKESQLDSDFAIQIDDDEEKEKEEEQNSDSEDESKDKKSIDLDTMIKENKKFSKKKEDLIKNDKNSLLILSPSTYNNILIPLSYYYVTSNDYTRKLHHQLLFEFSSALAIFITKLPFNFYLKHFHTLINLLSHFKALALKDSAGGGGKKEKESLIQQAVSALAIEFPYDIYTPIANNSYQFKLLRRDEEKKKLEVEIENEENDQETDDDNDDEEEESKEKDVKEIQKRDRNRNEINDTIGSNVLRVMIPRLNKFLLKENKDHKGKPVVSIHGNIALAIASLIKILEPSSLQDDFDTQHQILNEEQQGEINSYYTYFKNKQQELQKLSFIAKDSTKSEHIDAFKIEEIITMDKYTQLVKTLVISIIQTLKLHDNKIRDESRQYLTKIVKVLGLKSLPLVVYELQSILKEGYQRHISLYTLRSLLISVMEEYQSPAQASFLTMEQLELLKKMKEKNNKTQDKVLKIKKFSNVENEEMQVETEEESRLSNFAPTIPAFDLSIPLIMNLVLLDLSEELREDREADGVLRSQIKEMKGGNKFNEILEIVSRCLLFRPTYALLDINSIDLDRHHSFLQSATSVANSLTTLSSIHAVSSPLLSLLEEFIYEENTVMINRVSEALQRVAHGLSRNLSVNLKELLLYLYSTLQPFVFNMMTDYKRYKKAMGRNIKDNEDKLKKKKKKKNMEENSEEKFKDGGNISEDSDFELALPSYLRGEEDDDEEETTFSFTRKKKDDSDDVNKKRAIQWQPTLWNSHTSQKLVVQARDQENRNQVLVQDGASAPKLTGRNKYDKVRRSYNSIGIEKSTLIAIKYCLTLLFITLKKNTLNFNKDNKSQNKQDSQISDDEKDELYSMILPFLPLLRSFLHLPGASEVVSLAIKCISLLISNGIELDLEVNKHLTSKILMIMIKNSSNLNIENEISQSCLSALIQLFKQYNQEKENYDLYIQEKQEKVQADLYIGETKIKSPEFPLSQEKLRNLVELITISLLNMSSSYQTATFSLIKEIISSRILLPELYDLINKIVEQNVLNHRKNIRDNCSSLIIQFLLYYPLGEKRMKTQIDQLIKNCDYFYETGRASAFETLLLVIKQFPLEVIEKYASTFFVTLTLKLANEKSKLCREIINQCLSLLIKRVNKETFHTFQEYGIRWFSTWINSKSDIEKLGDIGINSEEKEEYKKEQEEIIKKNKKINEWNLVEPNEEILKLVRIGAQILSILIKNKGDIYGEKTDFVKHIIFLLMKNFTTLFLLNSNISIHDRNYESTWHTLYHLLLLLEQLYRVTPQSTDYSLSHLDVIVKNATEEEKLSEIKEEFYYSRQFLDCIIDSLLFPHLWIRSVCSRILLHYFKKRLSVNSSLNASNINNNKITQLLYGKNNSTNSGYNLFKRKNITYILTRKICLILNQSVLPQELISSSSYLLTSLIQIMINSNETDIAITSSDKGVKHESEELELGGTTFDLMEENENLNVLENLTATQQNNALQTGLNNSRGKASASLFIKEDPTKRKQKPEEEEEDIDDEDIDNEEEVEEQEENEDDIEDAEADDSSEENDEELLSNSSTSLVWTMHRLRAIGADIRGSRRVIILRILKDIVTNVFSKELIINYLPQIIEVPIRVMLTPSVSTYATRSKLTKDELTAELEKENTLKELANDILVFIEKLLGSVEYMKVFSQIQLKINKLKSAKKLRMKAEAVRNPKLYAQKKLEQNRAKRMSSKKKAERHMINKGKAVKRRRLGD